MENTQLTQPADAYLGRARELHLKAQATGLEFLEIAKELGQILFYAQSDPKYHRKFQAYCIDAGIPKTTAYRYIQIYTHANQIKTYLDDGDTVVNALKKAINSNKKESQREIDITPMVKVIEDPPQGDAVLFNPNDYPNPNHPEQPPPNRDKNNYRARLATMKKNKAGSQSDIDRRITELDSYVSQAEKRIAKRIEANLKDESKIKDYNNEKEIISGYRIVK